MKYVVIGSSAAGVNAVRELRRLDKNAEITLVSKDKFIYSRCILHKYLSGERTMEEMNFVEKDFETLYKVNWVKGLAVTKLNREDKSIVLENGEQISYDKLLIATGSGSFMPPIKNLAEAKNKIGFRNIEDIETLKEIASNRNHIVIVGAGLVGVDCASGFLGLGKKVSLIDTEGWILSKQLDQKAADRYIKAFEKEGITQYYGVKVMEVKLDENSEITELVLDDGRTVPCDYLVVTTGVRANVSFLEGSGLETDSLGLIFDETGKTCDDDIYGAGDVSGKHPIWPVAVKEGIVAAGNMAGVPNKMTDFFASKSTMNFLGIPTMSLGDVNPAEGELSVEIKETEDSYKKIIHDHGKITGAILQGDLNYGGILQQLISRHIDVSRIKKPIFDVDYSDFFHIDDNFEYYYDEKGE